MRSPFNLGAVPIVASLVFGAGLWHAQDDSPKESTASESAALQAQDTCLHSDQLNKEITELKSRIESLELELTASEGKRFQLEQEFLLWQQVISGMDPAGIMRKAGVIPSTEQSANQEVVAVLPDPAALRAKQLGVSLRNLMTSEGLHGLDLLEVGRFEAGAIGPAVFRMLDDRGRLIGSLSADRVYFEASVTARTVTMILVDGHETHGGLATPFETRRIPYMFVDPWPWVEALPELFPGFTAGEATPSGIDDGKWTLEPLRERLNSLLSANPENGYFKVKHIDGVANGQLRGLHLVELSPTGLVTRHMFADRASITMEDRGVSIRLEDGASMRGDEKTPFLRGRFRIYLPNASQVDWKAEPLPGLTPQ